MVEHTEADGMGPGVEDEGRRIRSEGGAEQEDRGEKRRCRYFVTA